MSEESRDGDDCDWYMEESEAEAIGYYPGQSRYPTSMMLRLLAYYGSSFFLVLCWRLCYLSCQHDG